MPKPFKKLLRSIIGGDPLPALPSSRAFPSSSTPPSPVSTASSPLFMRIPAEIRRQILVAAFGGRTVHLHLYFDHPPKTASRSRPHDRRMRNRLAPKRWFWAGFICYRSPTTNYADTPPGHAEHASTPHADKCVDFNLQEDGIWPWEVPRRYSVGVMGWLRTCRQAYTEGVQVLYETNVFHLIGPELVRNLPKVLPERNLATIRRVELVWNGLSPWVEDGEELADETLLKSDEIMTTRPGMRRFVEALGAVHTAFANLQFLYISMNGKLVSPMVLSGNQNVYTQLEVVVGHIDRTVAKMHEEGQIADCRIALPTSCYGMMKLQATGRWIQGACDDDREPEAVWRGIVVRKEGLLGDPNGEGKNNKSTKGLNDGEQTGYWLVHGRQDMPIAPTLLNVLPAQTQ